MTVMSDGSGSLMATSVRLTIVKAEIASLKLGVDSQNFFDGVGQCIDQIRSQLVRQETPKTPVTRGADNELTSGIRMSDSL